VSESRFMRRDRVIAATIAAVVLVWLYRVLSVWTDRPTVFLLAFALLLALLLLLGWVVDVIVPRLWRLLRSLATSIGRAVAHDPEIEGLLERHPRVGGWLRRRFSLERWTGWYLTATVLVAAYFAASFASIAEGVLERGDLAAYDVGLAALLRAFRTPAVTRLMWGATVFGDPVVVWVVSVVFVLLLLLWGRRGEAVLVAVTMTVGSLAGAFAKVVVQRQRPPAAFALIHQPVSRSFPSGHALASILFFTLLAFVLWRTVGTTPRRRFAIVAVCALGALLVGLSRVYLGVHWPTDVVGGWYLGAAWLSATIGGFLMWEHYAPGAKQWAPLSTRRVRLVVTAGAVGAVVVALVGGAQADPLLRTLVAPAAPAPHTSADLPAFERDLPRFSEKLDGSPQEPVSIVFVGSRAQLIAAFHAAGWQVADQPTLVTVIHNAVAALGDQPYLTAPVTPSFVGGKANDLAFEKPQGRATARVRHHARFWLTNLMLDGRPVWVATASFDEGLKLGPSLPIPTHHIASDIDRERDFVERQLDGTGLSRETADYRVTRPETGTNAQGDTFFTDGVADVMEATAR
jgi:membrane-associated phospholipid phosphatase